MGRRILQVPFSGSTITASPANNSNWPQLNDPTINKAIDNAVNCQRADAARRGWGKVDDQISALAPAIPWVWDNEAYVRSNGRHGVVNLFNAEWDLVVQLGERAAREDGLSGKVI